MAATTTNDLKSGMTLDLPEGLFQVVDFQHVKPGKGPAFVRTTLRNVRIGRRARQDLPGRRAGRAGRRRQEGDAVPVPRRRRLRVHGQRDLRADPRGPGRPRRRHQLHRRRLDDGAAVLQGRDRRHRPARRRRADRRRRPSPASRATACRAPASRPRSRPAWSCRCRCSSTRASASRSTPAAPSTSPGPDPRARVATASWAISSPARPRAGGRPASGPSSCSTRPRPRACRSPTCWPACRSPPTRWPSSWRTGVDAHRRAHRRRAGAAGGARAGRSPGWRPSTGRSCASAAYELYEVPDRQPGAGHQRGGGAGPPVRHRRLAPLRERRAVGGGRRGPPADEGADPS